MLDKNKNFSLWFPFLFLFLFSLIGYNSFSQLDSYTITRTAPSCACFTSITGTGTAVTTWLNGTNDDDNLSASLPIGFSFTYDGGVQTQFKVSTNGFITFNTASPADGGDLEGCGTAEPYTWDNPKFTSTGRGGTLQAISPFYNDLICYNFSLNTSVYYQLTGSAPNRILTVQWRGLANDWSGDSDCSQTAGNLNFQVKLYETSNNIEFIYSTMTQTSYSCSGSGSASIDNTYTSGINSSTMSGAPTIAQLITQQTANTATFNNTAKNNLTTLPSANSRITFTWTAPAAPGAAPPCAVYNFPANSSSNMCINTYLSWGNTGGVPTGYDVFFGTAVAPPLVSANQTSTYYNPGALSANTTYYWKIVPKNGFGDAAGCTTNSFATGPGDVAPTSISSSAGNSFCVGTTSTISIVGGNLSSGSVWSWSTPFVFDFGCKVNPCYPLFGPWGNSSYTNTYNSAGTYKYYVFTRGCNGTSSCTSITITVLDNSNTTPTGVTSSAGNPICAGTTTTLTPTGGTLGSGANNVWYNGSICGGASIGTGSISVTPGATTTYSVRREGGTTCPNTTSCFDITITVQTGLANNTVSSAQTICSGQTPAGLTGSLPTGGSGTYTYLWESSTTSGVAGFAAAGGTNNTQNYSPGTLTQTTWYRRVVTSGACTGPNSITSASIQITVNPVPGAAGAISGTATVCQGQNGVSYSLGAISGATGYNWVLPAGASIASGSNTNSITVNFSGSASAGNITVDGTNGCGTGASSSFAVAINTASTAPTATASPPSVCSGSSSSLSITSGTLGTGAVWNWYTVSCGGTLAGTGSSISVNPTSTTVYYVRAQGTCNTTTCASVTVTVPSNGGAGTWTWTGTVSTDWFNACNWDAGSVPDGLSDVLIPGGTPFNPVISGAVASCRTRTINVSNGGNLTINTSSGGQCIVTF